MGSFTMALTGAGGSGVVALGDMLLRVAARQGYYGMLRRTSGPQIRGGESAAIIRLDAGPVAAFRGEIDLLMVLDWANFQRFSDEIPLRAGTLVIQDQSCGELPEILPADMALQTLDFSGVARSLGTQHANIAMLGFLAAWLGCPPAVVDEAIGSRLHRQAPDALRDARVVAAAGMAFYQQTTDSLALPQLPVPARQGAGASWIATGNQLAGLGALEAGVRMVSAYPITPASDALEWIAGRIEQVGGHLVQAEDELAAVNMAIGAGFGGVPAMTVTSGPGLSLMTEAMGLAVASETPLVVLNVMRGGPSTGIPTKGEQSDLNLAVYGLHGDAPHVVLGALSIADCHHTVAWAVQLASELQTLVIVLSDQFLGQSTQILPELPAVPYRAEICQAGSTDGSYSRYLDTESGISPMALPGQAGCMYTADGLEHGENAVPSPRASDHQRQLDKRLRKLMAKDFGPAWAQSDGSGELLLICWGSVYPSALEAQRALLGNGVSIRLLGIRLLHPLPRAELESCCRDARHILVVEQNHSGQFARHLRSLGLDCLNQPGRPFHSVARPGPVLFTPAEIECHVMEVLADAG